MADDEGRPTPELTRLYEDLARGRVGLIVTSHAFVSRRGQGRSQQLGVHDDALIAPLRRDDRRRSRRRRQDRPAAGSRGIVVGGSGAAAGTGTGARAPAPRLRAAAAGPSVRQTDTGPVGREMTLDGYRRRHPGLRGGGRARAGGRLRRRPDPRGPRLPAQRVPVAAVQPAQRRLRGRRRRPGAVRRGGGRGRARGGGAGLPGAHQDELRGLRPRRRRPSTTCWRARRSWPRPGWTPSN